MDKNNAGQFRHNGADECFQRSSHECASEKVGDQGETLQWIAVGAFPVGGERRERIWLELQVRLGRAHSDAGVDRKTKGTQAALRRYAELKNRRRQTTRSRSATERPGLYLLFSGQVAGRDYRFQRNVENTHNRHVYDRLVEAY